MRNAEGRRTKADVTVLVAEARDRVKHLRADMKAQPAKYSPGMRRTIKDDVPALCDLVERLIGRVEVAEEELGVRDTELDALVDVYARELGVRELRVDRASLEDQHETERDDDPATGEWIFRVGR